MPATTAPQSQQLSVLPHTQHAQMPYYTEQLCWQFLGVKEHGRSLINDLIKCGSAFHIPCNHCPSTQPLSPCPDDLYEPRHMAGSHTRPHLQRCHLHTLHTLLPLHTCPGTEP